MLPYLCSASVTVKVLNKTREHYILRVLYYTTATAWSCEHFPFPSYLYAPLDLSGVNVVSAFYAVQVGRAYPFAAMQHPSHTRGNRRMVYGVLLLTVDNAFSCGS